MKPHLSLYAAKLSIYYHAVNRGDEEEDVCDSWFYPMPLEMAVQIVASKTSEGSLDRLLCASQLLALTSYDRGQFKDDETRDLLRQLGIPVEELEKYIHNHRIGEAGEPLTYVEMEILLFEFWKVQVIELCVPELISNDVGFDSIKNSTQAHYRARVNRPFGVVKEALDPQNWDECSEAFKTVYIAQRDGGTGEYEVDANYDGIEEPNPPRAGEKWKGVIFENFEFNMGLFTAWFRNFISVEAYYTDGTGGTDLEFRYHYKLYEAIRSYIGPSILWPEEIDGGIDIDEGFFRMTEDPDNAGSIIIEGYKLIRMSDRGAILNPILNKWTEAFLRFMAGEGMKVACDCNPPELANP